MADYMRVLNEHFPTTQATCEGDTSVFTNITFHANSKTQAELDAKWLDTYKHQKNIAIDERTAEIISQPFTYDSQSFSTSDAAQRNWIAIYVFKDVLTYPMFVSTYDDGEYELADATAVTNMVLTGLAWVQGSYSAGRALKLQVNAATDEAGVDAIQDTR